MSVCASSPLSDWLILAALCAVISSLSISLWRRSPDVGVERRWKADRWAIITSSLQYPILQRLMYVNSNASCCGIVQCSREDKPTTDRPLSGFGGFEIYGSSLTEKDWVWVLLLDGTKLYAYGCSWGNLLWVLVHGPVGNWAVFSSLLGILHWLISVWIMSVPGGVIVNVSPSREMGRARSCVMGFWFTVFSFKFCKRSCLKLTSNKSQRKKEEEKI
jgi:hypothetical protein